MQRTPVVSDSGSEFGGFWFKFKFCYDNSLDLLRGGSEFKSWAMLIYSFLVASSLLGF